MLPNILESCSYAQGNVQTLVTHDCGVTYKLVKAGESLPSTAGACSYKVTIPDYPMQGESKFKSSFKGKVLASVEVSYDYSITDAIAFIGEAKYLGRPNSESDDATNSSTAFETAENSVIDKRIKEVARQLLPNEDIVDFSQADFEDKLLDEVNKMLKPHGIVLNFLSFVPTPDEQTRQAIDVATAMKVYESKGITDVGKATIIARAGATKVETNVEQPKQTTEK